MIVRFEPPQGVKTHRPSPGQGDAGICDVVAQGDIPAAAQLEGGCSVCHDKTGGNASKWNQPLRVFQPQTKGTRPDQRLIASQVANEEPLSGMRVVRSCFRAAIQTEVLHLGMASCGQSDDQDRKYQKLKSNESAFEDDDF